MKPGERNRLARGTIFADEDPTTRKEAWEQKAGGRTGSRNTALEMALCIQPAARALRRRNARVINTPIVSSPAEAGSGIAAVTW